MRRCQPGSRRHRDQWGRHQEQRTQHIDGADDSGNSEQDIEAAIGADTDPGAMRSGGVSDTPGDRGGGDGWVIAAVMADVMSSDLGQQHHRKAASVAIKRPPQE